MIMFIDHGHAGVQGSSERIIDKYRLLLGMQTLTEGIERSREYAALCLDCYDLLAQKLECLQDFILDPTFAAIWSQWERDSIVAHHAGLLRRTAVNAVCELEKYLSRRFASGPGPCSRYLQGLSHTVQGEVAALGIDASARVMLVGAGALPTTALSLARETGAEIYGIDIDEEAVRLAQNVVSCCGLDGQVHISGLSIASHWFTANATHFIVASLVARKDQILAAIAGHMRPDAKILLRYGSGIKLLFNYQIDFDPSIHWHTEPISLPHAYYEAMVLRKHVHGC